jgi:hypothetical protein
VLGPYSSCTQDTGRSGGTIVCPPSSSIDDIGCGGEAYPGWALPSSGSWHEQA